MGGNFIFGVIISIHAPRKGSDGLMRPVEVGSEISIHAPRKGSDSDFCGGGKRR